MRRNTPCQSIATETKDISTSLMGHWTWTQTLPIRESLSSHPCLLFNYNGLIRSTTVQIVCFEIFLLIKSDVWNQVMSMPYYSWAKLSWFNTAVACHLKRDLHVVLSMVHSGFWYPLNTTFHNSFLKLINNSSRNNTRNHEVTGLGLEMCSYLV